MGEKVKNGQFIKKWQLAAFALIYLISTPVILFWVLVNETDMLGLQVRYEQQTIIGIVHYVALFTCLLVFWKIYSQSRGGWKINLLLIPVLVGIAMGVTCNFFTASFGFERTLVNEFLYDKHVYMMVEYNSSSRDLAAYKCNEWGMFCERISDADYERARAESRSE